MKLSLDKTMKKAIKLYDEYRAEKDFKNADEFRKELFDLGIQLETDKTGLTVWRKV